MSIETAIHALQDLLGEGLSLSKSDLVLHGQSESHFPNTPPDAVAYATSTLEVAQILKICHAHDCPVVPWGRGTSLEGHALALSGGVSLDLSRMDKIIAVNAADMDCQVQPGVTRKALNTYLRDTGLFFPVDPGADASLGGMASTRASGTTAVRYGTMRDNVMGLTVVLADGRIIQTGGRARKSAAGYDLTGLFVGAEGTLGVITELTLRLYGQPQAIAAAVCAFDTVADAVDCVIETLQMGVPMARIELVDAASAAAVNAYARADFPERPHLLIEFHGTDAAVADDVATFKKIAASHNAQGFNWSPRAEDRNTLWQIRHDAYYAILASRPGARAIVTDICVPISRLSEALLETAQDIADSPVSGPILGHVGDGNFHAILLIDESDVTEINHAKALAQRMSERALRLGGTVTGEHGIGVGKLDFMQAEHGLAWDTMTQIKAALDPRNILNPGKICQHA